MVCAVPGRQSLTVVTVFTLLAVVVYGAPALAGNGLTETRSVFVVAVALLSAALVGLVARRFNTPPVLAEVLAGCLLGVLGRHHMLPLGDVAHDPLLVPLASVGVIVLMFEAGVEGTVRDVARVAVTASVVAVAGVALPVALGWCALRLLMGGASTASRLFLASALAATSVGITARLLHGARAHRTLEARVIVGAAILDDVLGLLILSAVTAAAAGAALSLAGLGVVLAKALGFLLVAVLLGDRFAGRVLALPARFVTVEWTTTLTLALGLAFLLATGAAVTGLAPLIGAFAAGLVLDEVEVKVGMEPGRRLGSYIAPVVAFLAPLFFIRVGATLDPAALLDPGALVLGVVLAAVAIAGKVGAGLLVRSRTLDGLTVGVGMVPRGEVGLIFLEMGRRLPDPAHPALGGRAYAAGLFMVLTTTLVGSLWLGTRLGRRAPG